MTIKVVGYNRQFSPSFLSVGSVVRTVGIIRIRANIRNNDRVRSAIIGLSLTLDSANTDAPP